MKPEEVDEMRISEMTNEEIQSNLRQRLLGAMANNGNRQRVIQTDQIKEFIGQGWEYVGQLPDGEAIVKLP